VIEGNMMAPPNDEIVPSHSGSGGPSHSPSWKEDSFEINPKSEIAEEPSDVPALLIECQHVAVLSLARLTKKIARAFLAEGGDDVKSAWPLWAGPHTCYNGNYNGKQGCKAELIRKDCLSSDCSL
ncbi:hypothetical protein Tco_0258974, partial [Tanacetum coccineum]